jgi:LPXTG-site transpeptidase (sortase) family protein
MKQHRAIFGFRRAALIGVNLLGAAAVLTILVFMFREGTGRDQMPAGVDAATAATPSVFPTLTAADLALVERLAIPVINVDAPVIEMGVDAANQMEVPARPDVVAWYGFTAQPGEGGNAVFAAHVNWHTGEYAVFSELERVAPGDEVLLTLEDGEVLRYRVTSLQAVDVITTDADTVTGDTDSEVITLITCHGAFDANLGQYRERLVVRAERAQ